MKNGIKKIVSAALAGLMCLGGAALASCGNSNEKNITVVVREQGSGTREAFDKVVTDGTHFLEEKDSAGRRCTTPPHCRPADPRPARCCLPLRLIRTPSGTSRWDRSTTPSVC